MIIPGPATGAPSPSGVRRSGDSFQDLIAWGAALRLIQPRSGYTALEIEINGVGNVDDVVLRHKHLPGRFGQVKWATNLAKTIDQAFLLDRPTKGMSLLEKFYSSYLKLQSPGQAPVLELLTNRTLDPDHPLLGHVDGRTDLLLPVTGSAVQRAAAERQLAAWAEHVGVGVDALSGMLACLLFRPGLTVSSEQDRAQVLMAAAGLRSDVDALRAGLTIAADWVTGGRRTVLPEHVHADIDRLGLGTGEPSAVLLVQAIDHDTHPEDATESVDWVELYEGEKPAVRCRPVDPSGWATMAAELQDAAARLEVAGWRRVFVRGAMRQATSFLVGAELPAVRGTSLIYNQRGQLWDTNAPRVPVPAPVVRRTTIGRGADIAIAVGVAVDLGSAVEAYVRSAGLSVSEVVMVVPAEGAHDQVVAGAGQAVAYAQSLREVVRAEIERDGAIERVHLFLAGPGGLSLLLGHRWNRVRPTIVYEHLGMGRGYTPSFHVSA